MHICHKLVIQVPLQSLWIVCMTQQVNIRYFTRSCQNLGLLLFSVLLFCLFVGFFMLVTQQQHTQLGPDDHDRTSREFQKWNTKYSSSWCWLLVKTFTESYKCGTPRRVEWATLAQSVTIRHFRSEDFPVEQDSTTIWAVIWNSVPLYLVYHSELCLAWTRCGLLCGGGPDRWGDTNGLWGHRQCWNPFKLALTRW